MRSFVSILFFTWFLNLFLPWWSALIPSVVFGFWLLDGSLRAFMIGLTAGGLAWFAQALYVHIANEGILTGRIAELMQTGSPITVILITFLIGGLLGGFGTLFGYRLRVTFLSENERTKQS